MDDYVINGAYVISVMAMAVRDVLRLRVLLFFGQIMFLCWGALIDNLPTVIWNTVFLVINAGMIGRILWERRPIAIPAEMRDLFDTVFAGMKPRDFLLLWELGDPHRRQNRTLVSLGETPAELQLVLDGYAHVVKDGEEIARIGRGGFVAEMSLLTGQHASADVRAEEPVETLSWSRQKLANLERLNPGLYLALQKALGRDVSSKAMKTASAS
ncbi:MAG: cyclic nucleotide-binding domain-containing protein [Pseudomonadota bacterium]